MKIRHLILLPIFAAACDSPTVPQRLLTEVYDYRLEISPQQLAVMRWPIGTTVRVYVEPHPDAAHTAALESALENAVEVWNDAALYREVQLEGTEQLEEADAVLVYSSVLQPVDAANCPAGGSLAYTTFCRDADDLSRLAVFPIRNSGGGKVKFLVTVRTQATLDVESVRRLVAHELGHVLGIAQHSKRPTDLMYPGPITRAEPSPADRATLQVLYHTRADITP
jgi:predicted Zn-dependent protease